MIRRLLFGGSASGAVFLPVDFQNHDKVSDDVKTRQDFQNRADDNETGMDRLKMMFSLK